ncbi:MAG: hypothetical protein CMF55_00355 [Legionellales bacterium]|nr:hypothetical protein [Legionellales bacterium]
MKGKHPLIVASRKGMLPQTNLLRRALIEAKGSKGLTRTGRSLAGGRHLVNTYRSVHSGVVNEDRFKRTFIEPAVDGGVSMTIDISGSMDDTLRNGYSIIRNVIASACAVAEVLDKLNVKHSFAFCDVEYPQGQTIPSGSTSHYHGVIYPFSKASGKGLRYPADKLMNFPANGGTQISTYAEASIKLARQLNAKNRVAIYMTDGCCGSSVYLKSLQEQARRDGIVLVGVVMGGGHYMAKEAKAHPNGVYASDSTELGKIILGHLAQSIKKGL